MSVQKSGRSNEPSGHHTTLGTGTSLNISTVEVYFIFHLEITFITAECDGESLGFDARRTLMATWMANQVVLVVLDTMTRSRMDDRVEREASFDVRLRHA
jgi:hypothetical protein